MGLLNWLKFRRKSRELERRGPARRRQKQATDKPGMKPKRSRGTSLVAAIAILMVWGANCFTILYQPTWSLELVPGWPVPHDVYAQVDFTYVDLSATEKARNLAAIKVQDIYRFDQTAVDQSRNNVRILLNYVDNWTDANNPEAKESPATAAFRQRFGRPLEREMANFLRLLLDGNDRRKVFLQRLEDVTELGVVADTASPVSSSNIRFSFDEKLYREAQFDELLTPQKAARRIMADFCRHFQIELTAMHVTAADKILARLIAPNLAYSSDLTDAAKQAARENIQPIKRTFERDSLMLKKGHKMVDQDMVMLEAHDAQLKESRSGGEYLSSIGQLCGWSLLITLVGAFFFGTVLSSVCRKKANLLLIALVMAINILMTWGVAQLVLNGLNQSPLFLYPALPLAFAAILLSLLLGPRVGICSGMVLALLAALQQGGDAINQGGDAVNIFVLGTTASVVAALSVRSARTRLQTFRAVAYTPIMIILVEMLYLFRRTHPVENWRDYLIVCAIAFLGCFAAVIAANILLPFLEFFFSLTTNISLLELSDLNHPLLKRLSLEAPGTYTHTMMVATLAEHAAEAIGANTLLTRVASYFHDIGKLSNPDYFTENSFDENMHEDLSPKMSSLIILNHVKEGLALAARYKLKPPLREAIATHHGTSLVYFFYHRAKTENQLEAGGGESEYRYPGPRPRSAEATIICLADPCEAASRSLEKPTPQKIDSMVDDIFNSKLRDGQLDNSELTMAQLHTVRETIKKTLRVMLHSRIAYPKEEDSQVREHGEKTREVPRDDVLGSKSDPQTRAIKTNAETRAMHPVDLEELNADNDRGENETHPNDATPDRDGDQPAAETPDSEETAGDDRPAGDQAQRA